jgi:LysR family hydrogen peroxide-inducible transcriptional activator
MTLTELRYATELAKTQHFGRAAEQCNISQPTLSIAIKKLESELGVQIFERTTNQIFLTTVGGYVIAQAHKVLDEAAVIKDIATTANHKLSAPLHIGAIFTIGPYLFPNFVTPLQKSAPDMPLIIEEGYTYTLKNRLRKGEVDVIMVALPFVEPDVVVQSLFDEPFMVILPTNHRLAKHSRLKPEDLKKEHVLLLGEGHCFRDQVIAAVTNINKYHNITAPIGPDSEANTLETLCTMVTSGFGITVLPLSAVKGSSFIASNLVAIPLQGKNSKRTVALAWRSSFPRHQAIDAVRNAIFTSHGIIAKSHKIPELAFD